MNNGKKKMTSRKIAELKSSDTLQTMPRTSRSSPGAVIEIHNLPDNITLTQEILKNNVCRICATYHESGPRLVPLYLCDEGKRSLAKIVNAFLPIKVKEGDGMPEYACSICTNKLHAWREMWDTCSEVHKVLVSQAELLDRTNYYNRVDKSQLFETVQSVLATYLSSTGSMQLVCQECDFKTSSQEFHLHLSSEHEHVRDGEAVEAFVREHVTFEDALDLDSDGDRASDATRASADEGSIRSERPLCRTAFSARSPPLRHLTEHDVDLDSIPCCGVTRNESEFVEERHAVEILRCESCRHIAGNGAELAAHVAGCRPEPTSDVPTPSGSRVPDETNQKRIPAVCPDCNRTFSNKYNMLKHMKSHGAPSSVKFECECGRSYSTRGNLVAHRRAAHLRARPHACADCGAGFPTRAARDVHARLHSGARPFVCPDCARAFRAKSARDKHRETHGPRRFRCELCGNGFRRQAHLRYHVGTHRRRRPADGPGDVANLDRRSGFDRTACESNTVALGTSRRRTAATKVRSEVSR